jgi:trk system potassium uptake protein TrkH
MELGSLGATGVEAALQGLLQEALIPSSRRTMMHPGTGIASLAGLLTVAGPLYFAVGDAVGVPLSPGEGPLALQPWLLLASCCAISFGGLAMSPNRRWDQRLAAVGLAGAVASLAPHLMSSPGIALAVALASAHLAFQSWTSDRPLGVRVRSLSVTRDDLRAAAARSACAAALVGWLVVWIIDRLTSPGGLGPALLGLACAWGFVARWAWSRKDASRARQILLAVGAVGLVFIALGWGDFPRMALGAAFLPAAALASIPGPGRTALSSGALLFDKPAYLLVATFGAVCVAGTALLALPASSADGVSVGWIDAAFTAVSAVCVTGLIVLDTPNAFSGIGQAFVLLLIQVGGLGIMTYSTAILVMLGRRLGLREESVLAATVSATDRSQLRGALRRLLALTFLTEGVGALALIALFLRAGDNLGQALWRGIFTAISAFCNAGFALQSDSLIPYKSDPLVLHVVGALIVIGGLSPAVIFALPKVVRGKERRAQVWLVLAASAALLVVDAVLIGAIEWSRTLAGLGFWDKLHNAWFQSVTLRTAGFNSLDLAASHPATLAIMMVSMFIGGSPGGTAGGIKTTTAAVLAMAVKAAIDGHTETQVFGRTIPVETVQRAAVIALMGAATLFVVTMTILLTQSIDPIEAAFEAVSALGTVGLSIGATAKLDGIGKIVIMAAMFAGRVGPVSMFAFLASRAHVRDWKYPSEQIDVG